MIVDRVENLRKYAALHPLFAKVAEYLESTDLSAVPAGTTVQLKGEELFVKYEQTEPKTKEQARLEAHDKYIDIQLPLSGTEIMGYAPRAILPSARYDAQGDIVFFPGSPQQYISISPGMFVIFFPHDGHAPGISENGMRKVIVKVWASTSVL